MHVEVVEIPLFAAEEERDAIMGAWHNEWNVVRRDAGQAVVTEAITEEDGFVAALVYLIQHFLETDAHPLCADVMQPFGQELDIHDMRRTGDRGAHLPVEDFATDEFEAAWLHTHPRPLSKG